MRWKDTFGGAFGALLCIILLLVCTVSIAHFFLLDLVPGLLVERTCLFAIVAFVVGMLIIRTYEVNHPP